LWAPLLPLLVIFAGYSNDEPFLERLAHFALNHDFALDLVPKDLAPHTAATALLKDIHEALIELHHSLESRDPEMMHMALEHMPSELRTKECLVVEAKCAELGEAEDRIHAAIQRIEEGFVTAGLDNLNRALSYAEQMKLSGEVMQRGKSLQANLTAEEPEDPTSPDSPVTRTSSRNSAGGGSLFQTVARRSLTRGRLSLRATQSIEASRRHSASANLGGENRATILTEVHTRLFEAAKSWPFKFQVPAPRSDGATSMAEIDDFLSKVQSCLIKQNEQHKAKNEAATWEIMKLKEALDEMQDLNQQLSEQCAHDGQSAEGAQSAEGTHTPQRVMPGQLGTTEEEFAESALVCLTCANVLCLKPDTSPEELAELRLQTKLLTERCRDLKAQLKAAKGS